MYLSPQLREEYLLKMRTVVERKVHYSPYKSDVYSLGLTMVYFCTLHPPAKLAILDAIKETVDLVVASLKYSDHLKGVVYWMLTVDEPSRPDFLALHEYIERLFAPQVAPQPVAPEPVLSELPAQEPVSVTVAPTVRNPPQLAVQVDLPRRANPLPSANSPKSAHLPSPTPSLPPTFSLARGKRFSVQSVPKKCDYCGEDIAVTFYKTSCGHYCCSQRCYDVVMRGQRCRICSSANQY